MTPRFIARQLSYPTGFLGLLIGRLMNRHNASINAFAVRQVDPTQADRVLEIGFGGGVTLGPFIEAAGFVAGLDRSPDIVRRARSRFADVIREQRAEFREGTVESIPFENASFHKVCTVNTIYFWKSLDAGLAEIHRVLSPGGRAVIGFSPKEPMERMKLPLDIFTMRVTDDVVESMGRAGFTDIRIERPRAQTPWNVIVANK